MSRWDVLVLCGLAACYRPQATLCEGEACTPGDAQRDGPLPDGATCVGTVPMEFCYPAPLTEEITLGGLSTDMGCTRVEVREGQELCIVEGATITLPANVTARIKGARPLVLVSTGQIAIQGVLDLTGGTGDAAGAASAACATVGSGGTRNGGGGGGFVTAGGNGGGGIMGGGTSPLGFRGGCPGGSASSAFVDGGGGGGAVYLAAASLVIDSSGAINVGGGGGSAGKISNDGGGGSGGGSGGTIVLDAPISAVQGALIATGGGGGAGICAGGGASDGQTPTVAQPIAPGGNSMGGAGRGGEGGSTGPGVAGDPSIDNMCGGGGGGGGLGWIRLLQTVSCLPGRCIPVAT